MNTRNPIRRKVLAAEREFRKLLDGNEIDYDWHSLDEQMAADAVLPDVETKRYAIVVMRMAKGEFDEKWWGRAVKAAVKTCKSPAVVYRFDRKPWMIRLLVYLEQGKGVLADVRLDDWMASEL